MSSAVESAVELLNSRRQELEHDRDIAGRLLRDIDAEVSRIDGAIRSLRGATPRADRSSAAGSPKAREGSVKDLVLKALHNEGGLTPSELSARLIAEGHMEPGREGSVRTALWQLRKDRLIDTDANGKSSASEPAGPSR